MTAGTVGLMAFLIAAAFLVSAWFLVPLGSFVAVLIAAELADEL